MLMVEKNITNKRQDKYFLIKSRGNLIIFVNTITEANLKFLNQITLRYFDETFFSNFCYIIHFTNYSI